MISDDQVMRDAAQSFRTLGICWTIYGVFRIVGAVWLASFSGTATLMFGALLNRVADPFTIMSFFHLIYTLIVVLSAACGAFGLLAGLALLAGQKSGRMLALIAGFLSLSEIPMGIALGIYTLIALLPAGAHASTVVLHDQASTWRGHTSAT